MCIESIAGGTLAAWLLPLLLAYAEIHYRFKFIPSRYFQQAPEILADLPRRLEPGHDLPMLLLVKDAHRYPVLLRHVEIAVSGGDGPARHRRYELSCFIDAPWWHQILWLPRHLDDHGWRHIEVRFEVDIGGKNYRFAADNYRLTRKAPFRCYFAHEPLPSLPGFACGDLHTHSSYTSDQVEFGAPPGAIATLAQAMGHRFAAITDHSYDLDDEPDNYLKNDPQQRKWQAFRREIARHNAASEDFVLIPGEEVSCGNRRGENVHLLVFDHPDFIPGAGDSGEKWLRTKPDLSIAEVLARSATGALHFAAHPEMPVPWLQRLLLKRGAWAFGDYDHPHLHGLQVWNGHPAGIAAAEASWVRLLLQGRRAFIIAGTDAHGNFNRFRQIGMPHLWMREEEQYQLFGQQRTIAVLPNTGRLSELLQALRTGACAVTSGPFLAVQGLQPERPPVPMGATLTGPAALLVTALSGSEYGPLQQVRVYCGEIGGRGERLLVDEALPPASYAYRARLELPLPPPAGCYYRAEVLGWHSAPLPVRALTNPIWHAPAEAPFR